ncbi:MAG: hypothetical protein ACQET1_02045, partial [Gemmatimonadota bacterium]
MTGPEFRSRFQLGERLTEPPVVTHRATDGLGNFVLAHFLLGSPEVTQASLVQQLQEHRDASSRIRDRIREVSETDGVTVVVTDVLEGFSTFGEWLEEAGRDVPAGAQPEEEKVEKEPRTPGAYTQLFKASDLGFDAPGAPADPAPPARGREDPASGDVEEAAPAGEAKEGKGEKKSPGSYTTLFGSGPAEGGGPVGSGPAEGGGPVGSGPAEGGGPEPPGEVEPPPPPTPHDAPDAFAEPRFPGPEPERPVFPEEPVEPPPPPADGPPPPADASRPSPAPAPPSPPAEPKPAPAPAPPPPPAESKPPPAPAPPPPPAESKPPPPAPGEEKKSPGAYTRIFRALGSEERPESPPPPPPDSPAKRPPAPEPPPPQGSPSREARPPRGDAPPEWQRWKDTP